MSTTTRSYGELATQTIQAVLEYNDDAARCIGLLRAEYGSRAAYLAAFAILMMKYDLDTYHHLPLKSDLYSFTFAEEMREHPDALRIYEEAACYILGIEGWDKPPAL